MEEFALSWNNFSENLANGFQNLLDRGNLLVDCTLACEGKLIRAHKIVLAICSPYFQEMFVSNPCKHPIIILKDVSYGIMSELLQFMYQGEVNVKQTELQQFMKIAETLQIKGLTTSSSSNKTPEYHEPKTQISPVQEHKPASQKRLNPSTEESPKKSSTKRQNIDESEITAESIEEMASAEVFLPQITMVESRFDMSHLKRENNNEVPATTPQSPNSLLRNNFVNSAPSQMNPAGAPSNFNYEIPNELHSQNDYKAAPGFVDPVAGASITMLSSTSLLHGNCIFNRNNTVATQQGMKTYWLCKSYRITMCRARCITHQGRVISATGVHNHPAHMNMKNQEMQPGQQGPMPHHSNSSQSPPHNPYAQPQPHGNMNMGQHSMGMPPHPGPMMHYPHFPHHHMPHHQQMMNQQMMQEMNMNAPPSLQITPIGTVNINQHQQSANQGNNEMLGMLRSIQQSQSQEKSEQHSQMKSQDPTIQSVDLCSSSPTSNQSHSPQSNNQSNENLNAIQGNQDDILVLSPAENSLQTTFKIEHNL